MPARSYEELAPRRGAREYLLEDVDDHHTHQRRQQQQQQEMTAAERRRRTLDELEEEARNLAEYTRSKMEEMGARIRDTTGSARDRAQETIGLSGGGREGGDDRYLPDEAHRRYDESMHRASGWTDRARDTVQDWGERTRDTAKDVGASTRDRLGDATNRAASWGERTRERVEELGSKAKDRLQDFGEQTRGKLEDLGGAMRGQADSIKHQMGDTMESARGRAQESWCYNADAAREIGGGMGREFCMPLPTDRICARHTLWVLIPLFLLLSTWFFRRRNPDKWNAGLKMLHLNGDSVGKMKSAKESAMEALREERDHLDRHENKKGK